MDTTSVLRHLLADDESLRRYYHGEGVKFDDIKMRMFLRERAENRWIPDHHYRLIQERSFSGIKSLATLLTKGLGDFASDLLELKKGRICVRKKRVGRWQEMITYLPPLILQCAYLEQNKPIGRKDLTKYYAEILKPNFCYTALPHPLIKGITDSVGFNDLHMHLNGSTETDIAWQDYLNDPNKVYEELKKAFSQSMVREQLEQESSMFQPTTFRNLLFTARRLRQIIYQQLYAPASTNWQNQTLSQLLSEISSPYSTLVRTPYYHPFAVLADVQPEESNEMAVEALMYLQVLQRLREQPSTVLAAMFHYYLLIQGLCNRLLVQQIHQYGFEQFQKLTLNGLREHSEREYIARFKQIQGNELRNITFLEGRFSPKKTEGENVALIDAIMAGWANMKNLIGKGYPIPELRLVAHFIKRKYGTGDPYIRHKELRKDILERGYALVPLLQYGRYSKLITGSDAAASEFDAPPEVFAPVFRLMRRKEIPHFTYHAGEDFHHLISGMRAIWEAVIFTGMKEKDRIGHAVAAGLSPDVWLRALGDKILISQGEWLDDLVFVWQLMHHQKPTYLTKMETEIAKYCQIVYGNTYTPQQLVGAWELRGIDPIRAFGTTAYPDREEEALTIAAKASPYFSIFKAYHSSSVRARYHTITEISTCGLINEKKLVIMQKALLASLKTKGIVMETLPTSNIRIGHHRDFGTYHLWNWLKWSSAGDPVPPIVLGTDDTGIFATNIINEYANIFAELTTGQRYTINKAMQTIKMLDQNGIDYRFE